MASLYQKDSIGRGFIGSPCLGLGLPRGSRARHVEVGAQDQRWKQDFLLEPGSPHFALCSQGYLPAEILLAILTITNLSIDQVRY
jgi:hypothetical protein